MNELITKAMAHLPHGPEFRFLDDLTALDPGKSGSGVYHLRGDEVFLRGHFPGQPLFPGVLLLEATAQLAGVVAQSHPDINPLPGLKLTAVRGAKILGTATPGQTIALHATITGRLANLIQAQVSAVVNDQRILSAEVTLSGDVA